MLKPGIKRFYKSVDVGTDFAILLDGRPVKTPAGARMRAPSRALAEAVAEEWRIQADMIVPDTMPLTKALNTVLDRIAANREALVEDLGKYAGADLLCYRASSPAELVRRQSAAWDPWLAWAVERFAARLAVTTGIAHVEQPTNAITGLRNAIAALDAHRLVAAHAAISITGSAVLGLAFVVKALSPEETLTVSRVDEDYQAELWGRDAEAEHVRERRLEELRANRRYLDLLDPA